MDLVEAPVGQIADPANGHHEVGKVGKALMDSYSEQRKHTGDPSPDGLSAVTPDAILRHQKFIEANRK